MGGLMSSRWRTARTKTRTDKTLVLDIRQLAREKLFDKKISCIWTWNKQTGECSISIFTFEDHMVLDYKVSGEPVKQTIQLDTTLCHYGGIRYWGICPKCNKRVAKLYLKSNAFLCRRCNDLTYYTCNISGNELYEIDNKIEKVLRKLNVTESEYYHLTEITPDKPKGMHNKTYLNLLDQLRSYRMARIRNFVNASHKLLQNKGNS